MILFCSCIYTGKTILYQNLCNKKVKKTLLNFCVFQHLYRESANLSYNSVNICLAPLSYL